MTKKKKAEHNKYYYEQGRNGWTPDSTMSNTCKTTNPIKESDREEMSAYVRELEGYVNDMENYIKNEAVSELEEVRNPNDFSTVLDSLSSRITGLLKEKNQAYGNTALNPPKIFSKLNSSEGICARIDDKLSRIQNRGINDKTEDTIDDLIGYLFLLKMSMK